MTLALSGGGDLRNWNRDGQRQEDLLAALKEHGRQGGLLEHLPLAGLDLARRQDGGEHHGHDQEGGEHLEELHCDLVELVGSLTVGADWPGFRFESESRGVLCCPSETRRVE